MKLRPCAFKASASPTELGLPPKTFSNKVFTFKYILTPTEKIYDIT